MMMPLSYALAGMPSPNPSTGPPHPAGVPGLEDGLVFNRTSSHIQGRRNGKWRLAGEQLHKWDTGRNNRVPAHNNWMARPNSSVLRKMRRALRTGRKPRRWDRFVAFFPEQAKYLMDEYPALPALSVRRHFDYDHLGR